MMYDMYFYAYIFIFTYIIFLFIFHRFIEKSILKYIIISLSVPLL